MRQCAIFNVFILSLFSRLFYLLVLPHAPSLFITGPPNVPVLFSCRTSVVCRRRRLSSVVCNAAGVRAGRPPGAWESGCRHCTAGQYNYVPLERHFVYLVLIALIPFEWLFFAMHS